MQRYFTFFIVIVIAVQLKKYCIKTNYALPSDLSPPLKTQQAKESLNSHEVGPTSQVLNNHLILVLEQQHKQKAWHGPGIHNTEQKGRGIIPERKIHILIFSLYSCLYLHKTARPCAHRVSQG